MTVGIPARASRSCLGLLALLPMPLAAAQSHKISAELAHLPASLGGDVREVRFSPDGSWLVYLADQDQAGAVDLYCAPADGSAPAVKLSSAVLGPYGSVRDLELTADRAVFAGPSSELHSVRLDGSAPTALLSGDSNGYRLTPDESQVIWVELTFAPAAARVYLAPIDGSTVPILLATPGLDYVSLLGISPDGAWLVLGDANERLFSLDLIGSQGLVPLVPPGSYFFGPLVLTPDSSRVVYSAGLRIYPEVEDFALRSVPIDGSAPATQLTDSLSFSLFSPPSGVIHFLVNPSSERVVYALDQEIDGRGEVYSIPVDGSAAPIRLNGTLVPGGRLVGTQSGHAPFQLTPDGARVVYRADQLVLNRYELFAAPIAGGAAPRISGTMVAGGSVFDFQVSPDSVGVVFRADRVTDDVAELFGVPFGGGVFPLSAPLVAEGAVQDFQISADDLHVVYRADLELDARDELFRVAITGGASTKLNGVLPSGGDVRSGWVVSPDSSRVAYTADVLTDEIVEAFTTPITTSAPVRMNDTLDAGPPSGDVRNYALLPGAGGAVYIADGDADERFELYRVDLAGTSVVKLSATLVAGGNVQDLRMTPDGTCVVYLADAEVDNRNELYSVLADGSRAPVRLNQAISNAQDVIFPELTADGARAVYFVRHSGGAARLFSVPVAGGTPAQLSLEAHATTLDVDSRFRLGADGARVVYRTFTDLFSAPLDGSQPPVKLNGRFGPGHGNPIFGAMLGSGYEISPDGSRLVYVSDPATAERWELFSVRMDGAGGMRTSVRLSAPLPPGGDVLQFGISADGARVVYCADQEVNERYELYSVPIEGAPHFERAGGPRRGWLKLNGPLAPGGRVGWGCCFEDSFRLSPDGSRVAFSAGALDAGQQDLFSAAIDGGDLVALTTTGISAFRFTPGGERVVYVKGFPESGIYSARVDATESPVRLTQPLSSGSGPYVISPDGKWVVYRADAEFSERYEVFARPIDGSQPTLRLSGPMSASGDVVSAQGNLTDLVLLVSDDSAQVIYAADQDFDDVFELHASSLPVLP